MCRQYENMHRKDIQLHKEVVPRGGEKNSGGWQLGVQFHRDSIISVLLCQIWQNLKF